MENTYDKLNAEILRQPDSLCKYPTYCYQKCGEPIGWLGRFVEWIYLGLIKHECTNDNVYNKHNELKHEVNVYDENDSIIDTVWVSKRVVYLKRFKHTIGKYTTYSYNTHYDDGMIFFGEVPLPAFCEAKLKMTDENDS